MIKCIDKKVIKDRNHPKNGQCAMLMRLESGYRDWGYGWTWQDAEAAGIENATAKEAHWKALEK